MPSHSISSFLNITLLQYLTAVTSSFLLKSMTDLDTLVGKGKHSLICPCHPTSLLNPKGILPPQPPLVLVAFNATCRRVSDTAFSSEHMPFHMPGGHRRCYAAQTTGEATPSLGNGWSIALSDQMKN